MIPIEYDSPFKLFPDLREECLEEISLNILKIVEKTLETHDTEFDDKYTFETSLFGRVRQLFIKFHYDAEKPWIKLSSQTMDYVPRICNIPIRIFKDDPHNPKKMKVFFQNDCEQKQLSMLLEENELDISRGLTWRLLIQAPATESDKGDELEDLEDDYRVVLAGYNPTTKSIVSMWISETVTNTPVSSPFGELPTEKTITRKAAVLKPTYKDINTNHNDA